MTQKPSTVKFEMTGAFRKLLGIDEDTETIASFISRQKKFSERTFGPGPRTAGITEHITKELIEIHHAPTDIMEWVDVIILAMDGAWRAGHTPEEIEAALRAKLLRNMMREWPDWRTQGDRAIQHIKEGFDGDQSS